MTWRAISAWPSQEGDSDELTRQLAMSEPDLVQLLEKNAVKKTILLMFANLGAMQLLAGMLAL
jgi:hypothetical protein